MRPDARPLVLLAAGGTGGHLFPAEALANALGKRGVLVDLATDERAVHYGSVFPARETHIIPSETLRGRDPISIAKMVTKLGLGFAKAYGMLGRVKPSAVVGFGGYPTLPPMWAARARKIPTIIHDANAVMGRANRMLADRASAIATSFPDVAAKNPQWAGKATLTGNPVRPAVLAAAETPYPAVDGPLRIIVTGGSQGARIMSDIVPPAIEHLDPTIRARLTVVQQARKEDIERVRQAYAAYGVPAEVAPFFPDLPARIASGHIVVSRAGASTVSELAVIGRPSILVPLPHALDQDQLANANVLAGAGGAIVMPQADFTPDRLADEINILARAPERLTRMAAAAKSAGFSDAAERLAELVLRVAGMRPNS
ncbi:UDP-N-acetylglucosamine--N-acetylmuramyl-(pentapeptide) pyrophosphoryl-undecaprenol N-acetylglucosamine transferase [Variibacter gotjawalensis]|uniref:UDP-N-acetylglucosamine--N-acetylmuramyl-(pentapeptide) pyrophosphoryl-undecaprenol N-acetylglucosamine transferase n=1 Tax=Variibacter gotjawalensis TaxID=1333996 RepID=A0A0S3PTM6_9BRAD|nr:undecaprenyldiphospho-muramoylpentapeptide beta-N-acetylglucosaminyltransferase [Variibacter gotjawalensis]NIK49630.1 UDP-N-acetylglucosamine--N-acetylmuramyl-(pentapeptide) pyrophosphoryl-undecaprenol N-acetylglucosamine transferase [Variibacter gotjawalensis]RZS45642.1 UDP-N-acetylglucosamine-N-acetylmuramylpentapeptide N-acetylglucosamine transferase [Variibacter gotjawalensis]BAT59313.1 UDP-N-acetylglucosamine--N-acetylmuramyl-(pentapeptide) pyrophosphoryl-undecaprenol N-acetylglucosamine